MGMNSTHLTVLADVKEAIASDKRFSDVFEPVADGLHENNKFWMVPVRMERFEPSARRIQLYAQFAELEQFLQSEKHLNVVLLPVIPAMTA